MAKEKIDLRQELLDYKEQFELIQKIPCTREENKAYTKLLKNGQPLPENICKYEYSMDSDYEEFYTLYIPELSDSEIAEYLTYKKLALLNTIKNCVLFFTVLTIIGLVGSLLLIMAG